MGLLPHLFSMLPHPQQSSHLLPRPVCGYSLTRYHTHSGLMHFWIDLHVTFLPCTTIITNDAVIPRLCLLHLTLWGFASHCTWAGIALPLVPALNSSRIFCELSVPFPLYCTSGTACIFSLSEDSFSWTSMTHLSRVLAAGMMMSRYRRAISAVPFCCKIAVIAPWTFLFGFMNLMWARACWCNSTVLIADAIS